MEQRLIRMRPAGFAGFTEIPAHPPAIVPEMMGVLRRPAPWEPSRLQAPAARPQSRRRCPVTTLVLMVAHGEIGPMPDCAIFADMGWRPKPVYEDLAWLRSSNVLPFPVHIVSPGRFAP